jgi:protein phosphatase
MPRMELAGATHIGKIRRNNEDAFALRPELNLAVVADGMGGAACGEIASAMTVEEVVRYLENPPPVPAADRVQEAIRAANDRVWQAARARAGCSGMGSTVVLAYWQDHHLWVANVGDSRAYRYRHNQLTQLSFDQNVANELRVSLGLTEAQIGQYPYRNALTMAIGAAEKVVARLAEDTLQHGDIILLCSDGLSGPLTDAHLAQVLGSPASLNDMVKRLIDDANSAGGPDNITAVLLRFDARP